MSRPTKEDLLKEREELLGRIKSLTQQLKDAQERAQRVIQRSKERGKALNRAVRALRLIGDHAVSATVDASESEAENV